MAKIKSKTFALVILLTSTLFSVEMNEFSSQSFHNIYPHEDFELCDPTLIKTTVHRTTDCSDQEIDKRQTRRYGLGHNDSRQTWKEMEGWQVKWNPKDESGNLNETLREWAWNGICMMAGIDQS